MGVYEAEAAYSCLGNNYGNSTGISVQLFSENITVFVVFYGMDCCVYTDPL